MLFSSIIFLYYFLPITLVLYLLVPTIGHQKTSYIFKNGLLLLASFLFYFVGEPKYCILMLGSILVGYIGGLCIQKAQKKFVLILFIFFQLALLGIFKYADFAIDIWNQATKSNVAFLKLALPIGISFYSFQIISYLVDVYRQDVEAEKNIIDFATYVAMFPQLIAGPIVRYESIQKEMKSRVISFENISMGSKSFVIGLGKKVLIADNLGELLIRFDSLSERSVFTTWIVAFMYMFQIYYDFSGYSDMAIGLGKMLGFHFPQNFNYPFISKSITEFWRRWHMTLGGFLKDYIYIPLGGSRNGTKKALINILIVWFLSGLWHGASANFIVWGMFFGFFLILEKVFLANILKKLPSIVGHLYTLITIVISFVIFRFDKMDLILTFMKDMFLFNNWNISTVEGYELRNVCVLFIIAIIGATPIIKNIGTLIQKKYDKTIGYVAIETLFLIGVLMVVTAFLIQSSVHPFLYFRF